MTNHGLAMKRYAKPLERDVQRAVVALYRAFGCWVGSTSQGFRRERGGTRCTPGIPDLLLMHPRLGAFYHEVKVPNGKLRASQQGFIRAAVACEVAVVVGGYHEALAFLKAHGLLATPGEDRRISPATGLPRAETAGKPSGYPFQAPNSQTGS